MLVIDDLDRIDPEHVFRILNIFAAQFDQKDGNKVSSNKFGFDRIVLVCHYENLKKIFQHKYGLNTDFSGYVDKYFSKSKFEFDSREIIQYILKEAFKANGSEKLRFFKIVLLSLTDNNMLTLREAIKLAQANIKVFNENTMPDSFIFMKYLSSVIDIDSIIERFKKSKHSLNDFEDGFRTFDYEWYFKETLADLLFYNHQDNFQTKTKTYEFPDQNLEFVISVSSFRRQPKVDSFIVKKDGQEFKKEFYRSDLFAILEQVAIRFKQLKG